MKNYNLPKIIKQGVLSLSKDFHVEEKKLMVESYALYQCYIVIQSNLI